MAFDHISGHLWAASLNSDKFVCVRCLDEWSKYEVSGGLVKQCKGTVMGPKCSCPTKVEHQENCPEFWPGGLRRSP